MKKIFLLLFLLVGIGTISASAQETRYQGEVYVAGGYGVGNSALSRLQLHTIQGARIGQCFSAGVGLGVDYYTQDIESGMFMIPVFADFKLYAPTAGKVDPFLMVDLGYGFVAEEPNVGGLMFGAGVGFKAGVFAMSLGYHLQQFGVQGISLGLNAIQLKVSVAF